MHTRGPLRAALIAGLALTIGMSAHTGTAHADDLPPAHPGAPIALPFAEGGSGYACTLAWLLVTPDNKVQGLTAGHCAPAAGPVYTKDMSTQLGTMTAEHAPQTAVDGMVIGDPKAPDWAVFDMADGVSTTSRGPDGINPLVVGTARVGDAVCTTGATSGHGCGHVLAADGSWITTDIARAPGDSGGPLYRPADRAALGLLSTRGRSLISPGPQTSRYYALSAVLAKTGDRLGVDRSVLERR